MDDIVERLRDDYQKTVELCAEAANEIERLREALRDVLPYIDTCNGEHRKALERGRAALRQGE